METFFFKIEYFELIVKIRPLMDGNLYSQQRIIKNDLVKIRPLMDGNNFNGGWNGINDKVKIRPLMDGNSTI